jgi:hypothetical protein
MYGGAAQMSQGLGAQVFNPESQYNAGLITANRKEAMDVQIANQQASNSRMNAIIGGVGAVAGAAMGNPMMFAGSLGGGSSSLGSLTSGAGYGSSLSTSQMAGGFNNSLMGGGSNLSFGSSTPMYTFRR